MLSIQQILALIISVTQVKMVIGLQLVYEIISIIKRKQGRIFRKKLFYEMYSNMCDYDYFNR